MINFKYKQNKLPNETMHVCTSIILLHSAFNILILVIGKAIHNTGFFSFFKQNNIFLVLNVQYLIH